VAIVDKYGELLDCKDLQHLLPPRKFHAKNNQSGTEEEEQRLKKAKLSHIEEVKEHEKCCDEIKRLIEKHQVDLIVVGANRLEARFIKKVLSDISEKLKNYGDRNDYDDDDNKRGSKKRQRDGSEETKKEAFVIWGSLEVPKLFANCHQSHKLLRNYHPIVKQAVSLARFEQDPLIEILNLWSFVPSENQVLQLNLHPMQKLINQAKLSDALEEINVQCVNAIGVDLNLVIDHDHMNIVLSFLSGIGPRKAKKFIQTLK
jgi:transcriptional accessory protein Tex/SPT6